jgi:hypothetical protein
MLIVSIGIYIIIHILTRGDSTRNAQAGFLGARQYPDLQEKTVVSVAVLSDRSTVLVVRPNAWRVYRTSPEGEGGKTVLGRPQENALKASHSRGWEYHLMRRDQQGELIWDNALCLAEPSVFVVIDEVLPDDSIMVRGHLWWSAEETPGISAAVTLAPRQPEETTVHLGSVKGQPAARGFRAKFDSCGRLVWTDLEKEEECTSRLSRRLSDGTRLCCGTAKEMISSTYCGLEDIAPSDVGVGAWLILKLDTESHVMWYAILDCVSVSSVDLFENGSLLVFGTFIDSLSVTTLAGRRVVAEADSWILPSIVYSLFVLTLSSSGELAWIRTVGPTGLESEGSFEAVVGLNDRVLVVSLFKGTCTVGRGTREEKRVSTGFLNRDMGLLGAEFNVDGSLRWAGRVGSGSGWMQIADAYGLRDGEYLIVGNFSRTVHLLRAGGGNIDLAADTGGVFVGTFSTHGRVQYQHR